MNAPEPSYPFVYPQDGAPESVDLHDFLDVLPPTPTKIDVTDPDSRRWILDLILVITRFNFRTACANAYVGAAVFDDLYPGSTQYLPDCSAGREDDPMPKRQVFCKKINTIRQYLGLPVRNPEKGKGRGHKPGWQARSTAKKAAQAHKARINLIQEKGAA